MKLSKQILSLAFAVLVILSLAACSSSAPAMEDSSATAPPPTESPVQLPTETPDSSVPDNDGDAQYAEFKEFNISLNPYLEFMNSVLLTSKYNEITAPVLGFGLMTEKSNDYTKAIKEHFSLYENAPIYEYIENMIPDGFTFSRPVEIMLSLGNSKDYTMKYQISDLCIQYCGGIEKVDSLLNLMKEFENETQYLDFFEENKSFYEQPLNTIKELVEQYNFISLVEKAYGIEQKSYNIILSSLMNGNFGNSFPSLGIGEKDINVVLATDDYSLSSIVIFHELSHPFINPLTDKYYDIAQQYADAHTKLEKYKAGPQTGYGDWEECINEHIVRAMTIYLLRKCGLNSIANTNLDDQLQLGYMYIPKLLERLDFYDNNREQYKNIDQFYPELLGVFADEI
jgi:hypothetical protein